MEGKRAYTLYDAIRRVLDPLRRDWDTFTQEERELIIRELEGFLRFELTFNILIFLLLREQRSMSRLRTFFTIIPSNIYS